MMVGITIVVVIYNDRFSVYRCLPKNDEGDRHFFLFLGALSSEISVSVRGGCRRALFVWPGLGWESSGQEKTRA